MRENTKTFILKSGRGRLQEMLVYYKALSGKILVFWIGGGRLQEMVAHGGSTLLFSLLSTYVANQTFWVTARPFAWNGMMRSLQEK